MRGNHLVAIWIMAMLAGCAATTPVTLVPQGPVQVGSLSITTKGGWNALTYSADKQRAAWTRDGMTIDRLWVFADIADGETLVEEPKNSGAAFPKFRSNMLPNDLVALTESYIGKLFGEGDSIVETSGLRPQRFNGRDGILFEADVRVAEAADRHGIVGAFIADSKLYLMMYLAAEPYYFERNREAALEAITSARL